MAKAMSVNVYDAEDDCSVVSSTWGHNDAPSEAYSCPPVPLRRRAKMKKTVAPIPPSKVTTPLSQSVTNSSGGDFSPGLSPGHHPSHHGSSPMLTTPSGGPQPHVSDDCAINELLEGRMDLEVYLPHLPNHDGPELGPVKMNVERRTPMMDLLVQVTTANKISPGGHVIHILTDRGKDFIHYKPSTPIGSLDTNTIHIVPKSTIIEPPVKKMPKVANKPFEQTFRLQVNLPRGQLMVMRVSPRATLSEVKLMVCQEKNLDHSRYQLVHPQFQNQVLDLNSTMSDFGGNEISLLSHSNINTNMRSSTSDLIAYAKEDEKKKKGLMGLFSRKKSKGSVIDSSSDSYDSRGISPTRSDGSGNHRIKVPIKKRPAPLPPPISSPTTQQQAPPNNPSQSKLSPHGPKSPTTPQNDGQPDSLEAGSTVSHSRHSSDSSGYHEASLLSESPDNLSPDVCGGSASSGLSMESQPAANQNQVPAPRLKGAGLRKSSTPLKETQTKTKPLIKTSLSDTSLLSSTSTINKKRKAPSPPAIGTKPQTVKVGTGSSKSVSVQNLSIPEEEPVKAGEDVKDAIPSVIITADSPPLPLSPAPPTKESSSPSFTPVSHPTPSLVKEECLLVEEPETVIQVIDCTTVTSSNIPQPIVDPKHDTPVVIAQEPTPISIDVSGTVLTSVTSELVMPNNLHHNTTNEKIKENSFEEEDELILPNKGNFIRQPSLTSLGTIDDVQKSFDQAIAEAEKALDREEKEIALSLSESRKRISPPSSPILVSQQQILSQIEAAFNAVEEQADQDDKPPPSPRCGPISDTDDLGWDYTIPEPPPAFRNSEPEMQVTPPPSPKIAVPPVTFPPSVVAFVPRTESEKEHSRSSSQSSTEGIPPPLPVIPPPVTSIQENVQTIVEEKANDESESSVPKFRRLPLLKFTIGAYKKQEEDIFRSPSPGDVRRFQSESPSKVNSAEIKTEEPSFQNGVSSTKSPDLSHLVSSVDSFEKKFEKVDKIEYTPVKKMEDDQLFGLEGSVRGIRGQVKQCRARMADIGASPISVTRSVSVLSLVPPNRGGLKVQEPLRPVQRANSNVDVLRKSSSVQDLNNGSNEKDLKETGLQEEFLKLHQQSLAWKQRVQDNQNLLEKQKIVPINEPVVIPDKDDTRSQTLPRQRSKFNDFKMPPVEDKRIFTLERPPRPKSQVLANVTIGSWQQRKVPENGISSSSSLNQETVSESTFVGEPKLNGHTVNGIKPRPVSMYSGSWQKPVPLPPKPKVGVQINTFKVQMMPPVQNQVSNTNSLRTSNNKTAFRLSDKPTHRLPSEFNAEEHKFSFKSAKEKYSSTGSLDIISKDTRNKKFASVVSETDGRPVNGISNNVGNNNINSITKTVTFLNGSRVEPANMNGQTKSIQVNGLGSKPSFTVKGSPATFSLTSTAKPVTPLVVNNQANRPTNGMSNGKSGGIQISNQTTGPPYARPSNKIPSPPILSQVPINKREASLFPNPGPPPPPSPLELQKIQASLKSVSQRTLPATVRQEQPKRQQQQSNDDPREGLMLEIRNFGGRTALKKVSVSQVNWQLKVHGSNSTVTA